LFNNNLIVTPNPSRGSFSIEWINAPYSGNVSIQFMNSLGQTIYSAEEIISSPEWRKEIDLKNVSRGVYLIRLRIGENAIDRKLLMVN